MIPALPLVPPRPLGAPAGVARPVALFHPQAQFQTSSAPTSATLLAEAYTAPAPEPQAAAASASASAKNPFDAAEDPRRPKLSQGQAAVRGRADSSSRATPGGRPVVRGRATAGTTSAVPARVTGASVYTTPVTATAVPSAITHQQDLLPTKSSSKSAAQSSNHDVLAAHRQAPPVSHQHTASASLDAGGAPDIVTTYSSFQRDAQQSYTAISDDLGSLYSAATNTDSSNVFGQAGNAHLAIHECASPEAGNIDEMTELQL